MADALNNSSKAAPPVETTHSNATKDHDPLAHADALLKVGDEPRALQSFAQALALGKQHGDVARLWSGAHKEMMPALCVLALMHQLEVEYVTEILRQHPLLPLHDVGSPEAWPWPVKIHTLGQFSVTLGDVPLETRSKAAGKPLELLKTLIAFGGRNVNQQKLIQALWPDGDVGRKTFEITLHRLRRLFGSDAPLILKNKALSLDERLCWVDCWALERVMSKLDSAESASAVDVSLDQVFNLYQGPFFGHGEELSCAVQLQERLRSRLLRSVLRLAQRSEDAGLNDRALQCYERLLEVEPSVEEGYRRLVRLYERQGRHADAKTCYHRCERVLRRALDVAPSFSLNVSSDEISLGFSSKSADLDFKRPLQ